MNQVDRPAEGNTWHDTPDLSRQNLKEQAKNQFNRQKPVDRQELRDVAGDATQNAHPDGSRDPRDAGRLAAHDRQNDTSSGVDGRSGAAAGIESLKAKASANVPDETKDRGRQVANQTRDYVDRKLPQERRHQAIYRLKKMIVEIQGHQDCACRRAFHPVAAGIVLTCRGRCRSTCHRDPVRPGRDLLRTRPEPRPADDGDRSRSARRRSCTPCRDGSQGRTYPSPRRETMWTRLTLSIDAHRTLRQLHVVG